MNEHIINLTLDINCKKTITRLFMGQYDIGRKAEVTVTADGEPYTCKNCTVVCQGVRGDNTHFAFDCTVNSDGHIITTFDEILKSSGIAFAKFVISDSTHSYSTEKIIIDCENALLGNIVNVNDYVILNQLIERLHALSESGAVLVDTELSENSSNPIANYVIASIIYKLIETKADTIKLLPACEGAMTFTPYSNFILGQVGSTSGTYNPDIKYRVTSEDIMKFDYDLNVSVDSGFTAYVVKYADGTYESIKSLSDTNGYVIPANTEFRLHIRRNPENTAETANINEFVNAVKFQTKIAYDVDNIRTELSENVQTANESKQIISEDVRNVTTMNRTETHTTNPFVCIAYEFKKGLSYTIEYSASASVSRIVTTATNSISSSQVVETIATGDLQNGTIVFSPKSDGAKYLTFVGAEKGAEGEKIALTITGKIASSLLEKVKNVDTSVSEISNVITRNLYNETSLYNSRSSGGFVSFPFEFEVGKRYKITFSSDREVDYIYNQKADTISSDDRVETIASPGVQGTIIYYTPTVEGGKYLVFRCADREAEMWVDVNVVYSLSDTIDSINNEIKNIKENGNSDPIPDYYYADDYLPNKIKEIREASAIMHGVTFAFITDVHFKANQKQSKKLLRKVLDETNVPFVICGGDIVYLVGTEEELYEQIAEFNKFKSFIGRDRLFCTRGNHDLYNGERENLFNFNEWVDALQAYSKPVYNGTLVSVDKNNETLTFSSTGGDCYTVYGASIFNIPVKPSTSYSLSFKQEGTQGLTYVFFNGRAASGQMVSAKSSNGKLNFTTKEDTEYITLRFGIDRNSPSGTTATVSDIKLYKDDNVLTTADVYDTLFRDTETKVSSMSVDNGCYCIDNEPQKTRIIMLNTTDVSGNFDYKGGGVSFRSGTLQWLSAALTEKTDYKIIIVCHTPLNYETFTNDVNSGENRDGLSLMVQAFKNKTEFETTRLGTTVQADFRNNTNELICVISGHRHIDGNSVENNVLNIVTTCDCIDKKDGYGRKAGTISEQAFDVFCINYDTNTIRTVRIGAGESRKFNYSDILGLQVDFENKTFTRLAGAVGLSAGEDFDGFSMYGGRKRCNVSDDGTITAYYGDENYAEDGSNGQVMVYQPKFYYKVVPLKLEPIEVGIGYHQRKTNFYISATPKLGFKLHPAFYDANGNAVDYILLSAYEGSMYDVSGSVYVNDGVDTDTAIETGDLLCSIAGKKPISGLKKNLTKANLELMAQNRGANWHLENIKAASANQLLMIIELGTMNTQTAIGQGVVSISDNSAYNCASLTGSTASIGNGTGQATETTNEIGGTETAYTASGKLAVTYRGVENPWGNIWKHIQGINIWGNGSMGGGQPYVAEGFTYNESKNTDPYHPVGFTLANASGYVNAMGYGSEEYDWLFMPSEIGGSSALPVGDYFYVTPNLNGYRIARLGGGWTYGGSAGGFCWYCSSDVSSRYRTIGGRLVYVPSAVK